MGREGITVPQPGTDNPLRGECPETSHPLNTIVTTEEAKESVMDSRRAEGIENIGTECTERSPDACREIRFLWTINSTVVALKESGDLFGVCPCFVGRKNAWEIGSTILSQEGRGELRCSVFCCIPCRTFACVPCVGIVDAERERVIESLIVE